MGEDIFSIKFESSRSNLKKAILKAKSIHVGLSESGLGEDYFFEKKIRGWRLFCLEKIREQRYFFE